MTIKLSIQVKDLIPEDTNSEYFVGKLYDTPYLTTNNITTNISVGMGPCVGIAICAKDINGVYHRIVCHCPYAPPVPKYKLEDRIEKYLKSINEIVDLKVVLASLNTFFEINLDDFAYERDSLIADRINDIFAFWKINHPDFEIIVIQSTTIGITPNGDFVADSEEEHKEQYLEESGRSDYNTVYCEESITLSSIIDRLHQFKNEKDIDHVKQSL
jgi:hypothetical protein